jgi:hypothetical protein
MKKTANIEKSSLPLQRVVPIVFLVLLCFVLGTVIFFQDKVARQQSQTGEVYGALGYGRGTGSGRGGRQNQGTGSQLSKQNCLMDGCLQVDDADFPVAKLDEKTTTHLISALADERKALATYQATLAKFGTVKPFINIARAEENHISLLLALFDKYGVEIPLDTAQISALPDTLPEICKVAVQAEIDNDALYQTMIPEIQEEDIVAVFTSLAKASKEMHLPAFERCSN